MNPRNQIKGKLVFGTGLGTGGTPVAIQLDDDQLVDRGLRPGQDVGKGRHGETTNMFLPAFPIRILGGGAGGKYTWEKVYPFPGGSQKDAFGGGSSDGYFALEMNGSTTVNAGVVVMAFYASISPWLLFVDPLVMVSGPSGPGGLTTIRIPNVVFYIGGTCYVGDIAITGPDLTSGVTIRGAIS